MAWSPRWTPLIRYDAAILGGGPAGASAAMVLARAGFSVVVLERDRFPREKLCGEFLSPEVCRVARELAVEELASVAAPALSTVQLHFPKKSPVEFQLPNPATGMSRSLFDDILLRQAAKSGAEIRQGTTVDSVEKIPTGVFSVRGREPSGDFSLQARAVLCAAGRWNRWTRARNGHKEAAEHAAFGFKAHFDSSVAKTGVLDLFFFPGGYCGISRVEGQRANICCLVSKQLLQEEKSEREPLTLLCRQPGLREALGHNAPLSGVLSTGPLLFRLPEPVRAGMFMLGDSAAFLDPFCGDGISVAMHSGTLAAESLIPALRGACSLEQTLHQYENEYHRMFRGQFLWARWLRRLVNSRRLLPLTLPVARMGQVMPALFSLTRPRLRKSGATGFCNGF